MKAQASIEFIALFLLGMAFTILMFGVIMTYYNDLNREQVYEAAKQVGRSIQGEIILASEVHDGYSRSFEIPLFLDQENFTIYNTDRVFVLEIRDQRFPFPIPISNGTLIQGMNNISKKGGVIEIN